MASICRWSPFRGQSSKVYPHNTSLAAFCYTYALCRYTYRESYVVFVYLFIYLNNQEMKSKPISVNVYINIITWLLN